MHFIYKNSLHFMIKKVYHVWLIAYIFQFTILHPDSFYEGKYYNTTYILRKISSGSFKTMQCYYSVFTMTHPFYLIVKTEKIFIMYISRHIILTLGKTGIFLISLKD